MSAYGQDPYDDEFFDQPYGQRGPEFDHDPRTEDPPPDYGEGDPYAEHEDAPPKVEWFVVSDLDGLSVPPRRWLVDQWLPVGTVTSLYGAGGVGKSLLAQQLATAIATGSSFFGMQTTKARVLGIFCEDDQDELHRRQADICTYSVRLSELGGFIWTARAGEQNSLVYESPVKGMLDWSGLFGTIEEAAKKLGVRLVILDNIAQLFGANENDRALVTSFVNRLHKLAYEIDGAVLLLGHPGKGGVAKEFSGSTAWDAAVRSRWLLRRPEPDEDAEEGEEGGDDFIRELVKAKANYSGIGDVITMQWDRGCFCLVGGECAMGGDTLGEKMVRSARQSQVDALILNGLDTLRRQKRNVVLAANQSHAATKVLPRLKPFKEAKVRRKEVAEGIERLLGEGRVRNAMAVFLKPSRKWAEGLGRVEWPQPGRPETPDIDP